MRKAYGQKPDSHNPRAVLSTGVEVEFLSVQTKIDALGAPEASPNLPPIPTYSITDVAGVTATFQHNAETIARESTPQDEREAWVRYQEALAAETARINELRLRIIATKGVLFDMPDDDDWVEEHRFLYGSVPDSPIERRFHYFRTEIVGSAADWAAVFQGVLRASGVDEEVVSGLEASFRGAVGKPEGTDAGADSQAAQPGE